MRNLRQARLTLGSCEWDGDCKLPPSCGSKSSTADRHVVVDQFLASTRSSGGGKFAEPASVAPPLIRHADCYGGRHDLSIDFDQNLTIGRDRGCISRKYACFRFAAAASFAPKLLQGPAA
jgi:hypothetical protein